jgi:NifU-like protein involved in Fe-S cluster formation
MLDDIYNHRILALAANIPRLGRLPDADGTAKAHSRLCGSTIVVDVKMRDGIVVDFAHDVRACALGQASSAIMADRVLGSSLDELREVRDIATRLLKEDGPVPEGKWADLTVLIPIRDYPARHASVLLTFNAVVEAVEKAEAGD